MKELKWLPARSGLQSFLYIRVLFGIFLVLSIFGTAWRFMPHTLPKAHANGSFPIQHIVFIIKENHSFDNYFGRFPGVNGATSGMVRVNGVDQPVTLSPLIDQSPDYCHVEKCHILDYNNGAMDHFNSIGPCVSAPYTCYQAAKQDQIPNYWDLASKYVLSDNTFASMHGPTFPNRLFSIAAASGPDIPDSAIALPSNPGGHTLGWGCDSASNTRVKLFNNSTMFPCFDFPTIADSMDAAGVSWKYYAPTPKEGGYIWSAFDAINHIRNGVDWSKNVVPWQNFVTDAQSGNLPAFSWVVPPEKYSEHPSNSTCVGENWSVQQINAVMQGSDWSSTAIFLSYDEWGGYYDHVAPVSVDPIGYGFRVPMIIISPYAHSTDPNPHVTHTQYEASSVLRFAEVIFNLASLNQRDATTNNMMDAFDFSQVWNAPDVLNQRTCGTLKPATMTDEG